MELRIKSDNSLPETDHWAETILPPRYQESRLTDFDSALLPQKKSLLFQYSFLINMSEMQTKMF